MQEFKHMIECFCCGSRFQFGPHAYHGGHIPGYEITVCRNCYQSNWDGWAPAYEGKILRHLREQGVSSPTRNSSGGLPRDWPSAAGA
jgi:hypothetical protein